MGGRDPVGCSQLVSCSVLAYPRPGDISGLYVLLLLYLEEWARRVAVPTNGGISPSEVWLYLAGGKGVAYAFGVALSIGVAAGVVWKLRGR
jgi:hypothetical protein